MTNDARQGCVCVCPRYKFVTCGHIILFSGSKLLVHIFTGDKMGRMDAHWTHLYIHAQSLMVQLFSPYANYSQQVISAREDK
jgi:hypothetical protein